MGKSSGSIWVSLGLKTAEFQKGIKRAKGELNGFQKFGAGLKGMFNPLTIGIGVVAGLGTALTDALQTFKDFEKANSDLKAVLNGTDAEMASLSKQAKELGASTAFTATEVSQLQKEFAKLGFDSSQIENMTEATLNLAAAAGTDLANAALQTGSVLNSFGLNSQDAAHVTDVMALSFSRSALDIEKFSESMKYAGPVSKAAGVSLEYTTAALGKLADANISGSQAGTSMRKITIELTKTYGSLQKGLEAVSTKLKEAKSPAERLAIAQGEVGERAYGALLVLSDQKDELGKLSTKLENADGAAKAMADTMLNNLAGDVTKAGSAWEGLILSIEDGEGVISDAARAIVQFGTDVMGFFTDINKGGLEAEAALKRFFNAAFKASDIFQTGFQLEIPLDKINAFEAELKKQNASLFEGANIISKLTNRYMKLGLSESEAIARSKQMVSSMKEVEESMPNVTNAIDENTVAYVELTAAQKKQMAKIAEQVAGQKATRGEFDELAQSIKVVAEEYSTLARTGGKPVFLETSLRLPKEEEFEELLVWINGKMVPIKIPIKPEISDEDKEAFETKMQETKEITTTLALAAGQAFEIMGNKMVDSMVDSSDAMGQFKAALLKTVVKIISMLLANAVATAITNGTTSASGTGTAAVFTMPAFIASAVGGVMSAFAAIPAFADGGIVSGPTMGLMGEYSGAKSNPEVIAPLDKLKNLIGDKGGMSGEVTFKIEGNTLVGILKREGKSANFSN